MSGKLRVSIAVDLIDEYTETVTYTDESGGSIPDYSLSKVRVNPKTESIRTTSEKAVTSDPEVWGYSNGSPDYLSVPNSSDQSNGVFIGADNQAYAGIFVRNTGRYYDANSPNKQGDLAPINASIILRQELVQGGGGLDSVYTTVCSISPETSIFLDFASQLGVNKAWNVKQALGSGNDPICVDYFMVSNTN